MTNLLKVSMLLVFAFLAAGCSHGSIPNTHSSKLQPSSREELYIQAQRNLQIQARERQAYERTNSMPLDAWNR